MASNVGKRIRFIAILAALAFVLAFVLQPASEPALEPEAGEGQELPYQSEPPESPENREQGDSNSQSISEQIEAIYRQLRQNMQDSAEEEYQSNSPNSPNSPPPANPQPAYNPDDWRLILVSPRHPVGIDFSPPQLETIYAHHQVDSRIAGSLRAMIASAAEQGVELMVTSAYRPATRQAYLHERQIERFIGYGQPREEAVATASTIVLPPGTSEHQTGLAVDIVTPGHQMLTDSFAYTPAGMWLAANSYRYGFILRYPRDSIHITGVIFEPWHFRYVGREHARAIFEGGYILEEYLAKLNR